MNDRVLVRCQFACPHGDQCALSVHDGHFFNDGKGPAVGCSHRHCFCNEANAWQRPEWTDYFMAMAQLASTRGTCDRLRVGAVIVRDHHVLATGYNGAPAGWPSCDDVGHHMVKMGERESCVRTIHAEENAILQCAIHGISVKDATIYTTASTCYDCLKRIAQVGIKRIVHAVRYDGARMHGIDVGELCARYGIKLVHHQMAVASNVVVQVGHGG